MKISRSYSRKINLGNYEAADFFSSRDIELPEDTPLEIQQAKSEELFTLAMLDVEKSMEDYFKIKNGDVPVSQFADIVDNYCNTGRIMTTEIQVLESNPNYNRIIQSIKRMTARITPKNMRTTTPRPEFHNEFAKTARKHFNPEENNSEDLVVDKK